MPSVALDKSQHANCLFTFLNAIHVVISCKWTVYVYILTRCPLDFVDIHSYSPPSRQGVSFKRTLAQILKSFFFQKDEFKSKAFFVVLLVKPEDYDCSGVGTIAPPPGQCFTKNNYLFQLIMLLPLRGLRFAWISLLMSDFNRYIALQKKLRKLSEDMLKNQQRWCVFPNLSPVLLFLHYSK